LQLRNDEASDLWRLIMGAPEIDRVDRLGPDGSSYITATEAATAAAAAGLGFNPALAVPAMAATNLQDAVEELQASIAAGLTPGSGFRKASLTLATGAGAAGTFDLTLANLDGTGAAKAAAQQYAVRMWSATGAVPPVLTAGAPTGITATTGTRQAVGALSLCTTAAGGTYVGVVSGVTAGTVYYVEAVPVGIYGLPIIATVTSHA
jgi:hypothetical protein